MAPLSVDLPWSNSTVSVSIIDTTLALNGMPPENFIGPNIKGWDALNAVAYSFLVTHGDSNVLFDLGAPKNWAEDLPPSHVADIQQLIEGGSVSLDTIDAAIWSHHHWDHIGRPSLFPSSTELILGPGTLEKFGAGWPVNETSPYLAREFSCRIVTEIEFPEDAPRIGGLHAHDYFGDGSFYLLEASGHEYGQLNGLARVTTNPETYIYMGADAYHHASQLRPSESIPLPQSIDLYKAPMNVPNPLPAELLYPIHPASQDPDSLPPWAANLTSSTKTPFTTTSDDSPVQRMPAIARDVVSKLQAFDADERVFMVSAHDRSLHGIIEFFPKKANDWKEKGWKEHGRWQFLTDFEDALGLGDCQAPTRRARRRT
ncbi:hypothetical protein BKA56DRAFT_647938 [Ilyonectria sp. MPI-CAGE-AT-0026]|nr:hypothetical protein BKA56DRAFT_647938 [Ilyonectria sp. MPI-CAGE-AT-0026]